MKLWNKIKKAWNNWRYPHKHTPRSRCEIIEAELTEPGKPSRMVKMRVHTVVCETCGDVLSFNPMGVVEDKEQ